MLVVTRCALASAIFFSGACGPDLERRAGRLTVEVNEVPADTEQLTLVVQQERERLERRRAVDGARVTFFVESVPIGEVRVDVLPAGPNAGGPGIGRTIEVVEAGNLVRLSFGASSLEPVRGTVQAVLTTTGPIGETIEASGAATGWPALIDQARARFGADPSRLELEAATATVRPAVDETSFDDLWEEDIVLFLGAGGLDAPVASGIPNSNGGLLVLTPVTRALDGVSAPIVAGEAVTARLSGAQDGEAETIQIDLTLTVLARP